MYQHGKHPDDTTDSKAAGIAHKHLGWESIIPKKSDRRTDKCTRKDNKFFAPGYIHDIEV